MAVFQLQYNHLVLIFLFSIITSCAADEAIIQPVTNPKESHRDAVLDLLFTSDGKYLISGGKDGNLILWNPVDGRYIKRLRGDLDYVFRIMEAGSPGNIWTSNYGGFVIRWNLAKGIVRRYRLHSDFVTGIAYNAQNKSIISVSWDGSLLNFNSSNGSVIRRCIKSPDPLTDVVFVEETGEVVASTSKGELLVYLLTACESKKPKVVKAHSGIITSMKLSDGNSVLFTVSEDKKINTWEVPGYKLKRSINGNKNYIYDIAVDQNSGCFATVDKDNKTYIFDKNGNLSGKFTSHTNFSSAVAFSNNGKKIATGSFDATVKLWDMVEFSLCK